MIKPMFNASAAGALILAATVAGSAFAHQTTTTETTKTTTAGTAAPMTRSKTKTKQKTKSPATATTPATTTSTTTETSAQSATAMPDAMAMPATNAAPAMAAPAGTAAPLAPGQTATATVAAANPMVGGAAMAPTKTIVENASAASNLTTLVKAVTAADLATTLSGPGPFTVFAPTNEAFGRVPPATLAALLKPEGQANLQKVLKYHVVAGTITTADLKAKVAAGGGTAMLTTLEGSPLTVGINKTTGTDVLELTDGNGNKSYIETGDVRQSNGIVQVVNGVLVPKAT